MYSGTLTLIDIMGEFASHWLTASSMVDNPMISLHARHRHIHSHDENCTISFVAGEDYTLFHDPSVVAAV